MAAPSRGWVGIGLRVRGICGDGSWIFRGICRRFRRIRRLKPGDVLEYHLEAQDNFAFEGKYHDVVSSGKYRIAIMSQEQFTSLMNDLVGQVREQIKDIRNSQRSIKGETEDLHQQTAKQSQLTRADKQQAQELVARQATVASEAKQAAGKLDDLVARMEENQSTARDLMETTSSVRDDLNQVAEHPMKDAAGEIDQAQRREAATRPRATSNWRRRRRINRMRRTGWIR